MNQSKLTIIFLCLSLSGCELINRYKIVEVEQQSQEVTEKPDIDRFCVVADVDPLYDNNCDLSYWLSFWIDNNNRSWVQRKSAIAMLGDGTFDKFRKILLSQGKGTPFQDRLRAQTWLDELIPAVTPWMQSFLKVLVYQPSQEMLEFESALTILSRLNGNQSEELEEQLQQIREQQQQIEQLLKIEASMMEKREGINQ